MVDLKSDISWQNLVEHKNRLSRSTINDLFNQDSERLKKFSLEVGDYFFDYSKNLIDIDVLNELINLALKVELPTKIQAMFNGDKINSTEKRSVLHVALRDRSTSPLIMDGLDVKKSVAAVLAKMAGFSRMINDGSLLGYSGKPIKNVINIGIGGSDLGPMMAVEALHNFTNPKLNVRFVSNIDLNALSHAIEGINPEETIFIISSKTFTTDETMTNAKTARDWITQELGLESISNHFVAVSTNIDEVLKFGILENNIFEFWDFIGGRYSLCSAIGLSLMIAIGEDNFYEMLDGFNIIDNHFKTTPLESNIPVILALISIWYINFWSIDSEAIVPYNENLKHLPAYLQQLIMESNGKSINNVGEKVNYSTSSVIWGGQGTNVQHAFFQLFHQGTPLIPIDLIGFSKSDFNSNSEHQLKLISNMIAQSRALAFGREDDIDNEPYKSIPGNKPNNVFIAKQLTPSTLGQVLAIYEHKVFVEGIIWQINSFDQFGVELGKEIAKNISSDIENGKPNSNYDSSTNNLIRFMIENK